MIQEELKTVNDVAKPKYALCNDLSNIYFSNAGISRSSTAVIAYLMHNFEMTLSNALQLVREARPAAKPNEGFLNQLRDYEQKLRL